MFSEDIMKGGRNDEKIPVESAMRWVVRLFIGECSGRFVSSCPLISCKPRLLIGMNGLKLMLCMDQPKKGGSVDPWMPRGFIRYTGTLSFL